MYITIDANKESQTFEELSRIYAQNKEMLIKVDFEMWEELKRKVLEYFCLQSLHKSCRHFKHIISEITRNFDEVNYHDT